MTKKRSKFDWSILDRKDLISFMYLINSEVCNKRLAVGKFHKIITQHLKSKIPVMVRKEIEKAARPNEMFIGGTYYSDKDKSRKRCIEIIFFYSKEKTITVNKWKYRQICIQIADTILHEIIHMRQHRRRNFKVLPDYASNAESSNKRREQEYLGNSDEIDAYSFNIACALIEKFKGNSKKAASYLGDKRNRFSRSNWGLSMYLDAFDRNHNHSIIRRLKQKVIRYLPNAIEGKPYRSKDWINR